MRPGEEAGGALSALETTGEAAASAAPGTGTEAAAPAGSEDPFSCSRAEASSAWGRSICF